MDIKKNILKTITWFDLFDKAVSLGELQNFLFEVKADKKNILRALRKMIGKELGRRGDIYFLQGRESLINIRKDRLKISLRKFRKVKKYLRVIKMLPFVRGIAITQNLAISNAKETSDIDLLIVTAKSRIFITRFYVNISLDIFRLRRPGNKNRICPNFFISEDGLDISKVAFKDDVYLAFWVSSLAPVYNQKLFIKFKKENKWANSYFPNSSYKSKAMLFNTPILFLVKKIKELFIWPFANFIESKLKEKQIKIIEKNKKKSRKPSIVVNDKMTKVHYDDRRLFYKKEWETRLKSVDIH